MGTQHAEPASSTAVAVQPSHKTERAVKARGMLVAVARRPELGALVGAVGVFVLFALVGGETFLSPGGVASWLNVAAELGIIALPVGLLMIAGCLDLSVGSTLAAGSMTFAIVAGHYGAPIPVGFVTALVIGAVIGIVNGLLVTRTQLPTFVVTLSVLFAVSGVNLGLSILLTGSTSVAVDPGDAKLYLGSLLFGKFEVAILWWLVEVAAVGWLLHISPYGNWIFALGGDEESARAAGIPTARVKVALYALSGLAAAFVGVVQAALYNSAQVAAGQAFVFNSIIASVIGGVLLTGGYGSVVGIVLGTITFAIVTQGIYFTGLNANWASLILGALLLAAVLMNSAFRRLALAAPAPPKPMDVQESGDQT